MYKIYGDVNSGNCYKVKLLAEQLALPYEWIDVDVLKKETHSSAYLEKNPNGKIPLLETEDGRFLPESNAILHFLAEGSPYLPADRFEHARYCSGCSSNNTATSPTLRRRVTSSATWGGRQKWSRCFNRK